MRIWVDADAAPLEVKEIVFRASKRLDVEVLLVANRPVPSPRNLTMVKSIVVRDGADQADRYIVANGEKGDIAITADLPLAGLLVEKGLLVIDPRGNEYTHNTIASRLSVRNFMEELRSSGMTVGKTDPYSESDKRDFASTFDRLLTKQLRSS